jgi:dihydrofolate reductase
MSDLVVINHVSLDGVMQAPGRPDEDPRGGFAHGGWAAPNNDDVMVRVMGEAMGEGWALLLGRRTYEDFHGYWPKQDSPFTEALNNVEKYVVSTTLEEPLPWTNSTLVRGDFATAVADVKATHDGNLVVMGSGELIRSLRQAGLIDRYLLMVHPLVLGSGRRLFAEGGANETLRLTGSVTTTTKGVVIVAYEV